MKEVQPILYIIMRNDLDSMNPGKAMAQASHSSNAFVTKIDKEDPLYDKWRQSTNQGFGTVLVLAANKEQLTKSVQTAKDCGYVADFVYDPTYPYILKNEYADLIPESVDTSERIRKEKTTVMFRNEVTCCYIFMDKNDEKGQKIVEELNLHP